MKKSHVQAIRFLFVGVLNTIFGFGCYALFIIFGLHYSVSVALATVIGVLFNFKSTGVLVFNSRRNSRLPFFIGVYVIIYIVNVASIAALVSFGLGDISAAAIAVIPVALLSFILQKRFVFIHA